MTTPSDSHPPEFDDLMDTPLTRVKIEIPWWTRASAAVLGVAIAVAILVGTLSQYQGVQNERTNARFAREVAAQNAQFTELVRAESECRSARNAALTRVSSQLVGLTAKLFVRLAQRDPTVSDPNDPIYAQFNTLANQRDLDDSAADTAVEDCRRSG